MSGHITIPYGGDKHERMLNRVLERFRFSAQKYQNLHTKMEKSADEHQAYMPETDADALRRQLRDAGKPQPLTLVVPYSYAILMSMHTYLTSVFLSRVPVFQFSGRHGEAEMKVQGIEALIDYQVQVGEMLVPLYIWLLDAPKYGYGVVGTYWCEEYANVAEIQEVPEMYMGVPIIGRSQKKKVMRKIPGYQGSRLYNVAPWRFFPDPRVSLHNFQSGEFCGRLVDSSWTEIVQGVEYGQYIQENVEKLKGMMRQTRGTSMIRDDVESPDSEYPYKPGESLETALFADDLPETGFVELLEIYINLVPRDWGLGQSPSPEKWVFTVANEQVIIGAQPLGEIHNRFPFFVQEYESDGYELAKRSVYDVLRPMQDMMDWLINTHFFNVRKALNDQLIVDPSRVKMKDLLDPDAGKLVRAKPSAYGSKMQDAVFQLTVQDVTRTHVADSEMVGRMMQRVSGVTDNIMGLMSQGGRKTATEARQANSMGASRLKTVAEYNSALGWAPLAQVLVQSTQQHYDATQQFRVAGDSVDKEPFLEVNPEMIEGFFDYQTIDGTMPMDRYAQVQMWGNLLNQIRQFPQIMNRYDLAKMFAWIAQLGGLRNIKQFQIQVQPDQQVQQQAQAGNLVTPQQAAQAQSGPQAEGRIPDAKRPPGMGATG